MTTASIKSIVVAATASVGALALSGFASPSRADVGPQLATLAVVDRDTGRELRTWRHLGRLFVAGRPGARYSLRVTNDTDDRVLVVMSVDGVNIVTGQTAGYDQRGYVFAAHQTYDVSGWRKSNTEVAAFSFAPIARSYAARTGRPGEVGVIGIAVFEEKAQPMIPPSIIVDEDASSKAARSAPRSAARPMAPSPAPPSAGLYRRQAAESTSNKLGTAHGARERSFAGVTAFERATHSPQYVQQIEYDSYANLAAAGVVPRQSAPPVHPRAFPSPSRALDFVPDPPDAP